MHIPLVIRYNADFVIITQLSKNYSVEAPLNNQLQ